jgi:hypothetical protein
VYKALAVQAKQLGIRLLDVRSSISLAALTPAELDATVDGAGCQPPASAGILPGWHPAQRGGRGLPLTPAPPRPGDR